MAGIIIDSTVTKPLVGVKLIGKGILDILPPASAKKYLNTLHRAVIERKAQWCDYEIAGQVFVVLVEWIKGTNTVVVHETPYDGNIHDLQLRLTQALNNYKKQLDISRISF
ncbi:MAG: hypothetical protein DRH26_17190 [Deltaproteobacteria bacterium]|nr:MAG: hypothetical protein DRH26_17190 [Deltaproteobacteria bacterium]